VRVPDAVGVFEEADGVDLLPARLVPLLRPVRAVVAVFEDGVGRHLLVEQAGGVRDASDHRGVRARLADGVDEVAAGLLLEEVEDGLDRVELLVLDGGVALGQPADGGAERPPERANARAVGFPLAQEIAHLGRDVVDVRVVQLEQVDVVGVEPVERAFESGFEVLAVELLRKLAVSGLRIVVEVVADLRRERHLVATAADRAADYLLAVAVAVHVAGVDVRDARVERVFDHTDRLFVRPSGRPTSRCRRPTRRSRSPRPRRRSSRVRGAAYPELGIGTLSGCGLPTRRDREGGFIRPVTSAECPGQWLSAHG